MKRAGVAAATLALFILTPACAQPEELSSQDARRIQEVAGLYVLPDAFETYLVIELRPMARMVMNFRSARWMNGR